MPKLMIEIITVLIILIGFTVRVYNLSHNPAGFFADEASIGYNAWTIVKTGADEYGVKYPFFFRSFGDYRNPVPIYINIPSVYIFGLNEFAIRLTAAIAGTVTILLAMLIIRQAKLFENHKYNQILSLVSGLLMALMPWHIHFSRFGSEYIYFPLFLTLGWLIFLKSQNNWKLLPLSAFIFGICLYTYYPTWVITPLFVLSLAVLYFKPLIQNFKWLALGAVIFGLTALPLLWGIKNGIALTRWKNVTIEKNISEPLVIRFGRNYLKHFSPAFLFTDGDIDFPGHFITRFSSRGSAQIYFWTAPFVVFGLIYALLKHTPFTLTLLGLLLLYPVGSSLADSDGGAPLAFRSIIGVIPLPLLTALGIISVIKIFKIKLLKTALLSLFIIAISLSASKYLSEYHNQYPKYSSDFWGWQYGPRDIMKYFLAHRDDYDELYIVGMFNSPEIFIKFYDPVNACRNKCLVGDITKIDLSKKQLFAIQPEMIPSDEYNFTAINTVYYPSGQPAFLIGTFW